MACSVGVSVRLLYSLFVDVPLDGGDLFLLGGRLTELVAAVITAIVCRRQCGLIHRYQSSR